MDLRGDHTWIENGLDWLCDHRLKRGRRDGKREAGQTRHHRTVVGDGHYNAIAVDRSLRSEKPRHTLADFLESGDLAALNDVDAMITCAAGETPDHGVVPRDACAALDQAA